MAFFTKEEWKQNLIGCVEVALFMRNGISRFQTTREAAVKSFIVPAVLLPIMLSFFVLSSIGYSAVLLMGLHLIRIALALSLFLLAVYFLSRQYDRQEHFAHFVNIANWTNVIGICLVLPMNIGLIMGVPYEIFEVYAVFITLVLYGYTAFIVTHCFRFPWEFGAFIAIIGLAIDQNLLELTSYIRDMAVA